MDINTLKKVIRKYALDNALKFNGKASAGAVVGKVIGELPEVKQYMKTMTFEVFLRSQRIKAVKDYSILR